MKATGIVRRIDDLGRVVIPKEIRRTMRIREGDPLEIFTDSDGEVVFKKYSPVGELTPFATQYADVMSRACSLPVLICDRDHVVAAAGVSKRDYQEFRRKIGCAAAGMRAFPLRPNSSLTPWRTCRRFGALCRRDGADSGIGRCHRSGLPDVARIRSRTQ